MPSNQQLFELFPHFKIRTNQVSERRMYPLFAQFSFSIFIILFSGWLTVKIALHLKYGVWSDSMNQPRQSKWANFCISLTFRLFSLTIMCSTLIVWYHLSYINVRKHQHHHKTVLLFWWFLFHCKQKLSVVYYFPALLKVPLNSCVSKHKWTA